MVLLWPAVKSNQQLVIIDLGNKKGRLLERLTSFQALIIMLQLSDFAPVAVNLLLEAFDLLPVVINFFLMMLLEHLNLLLFLLPAEKRDEKKNLVYCVVETMSHSSLTHLNRSYLKYRSSSATARFPNAPPASRTEPPAPPPLPAPFPNSPS